MKAAGRDCEQLYETKTSKKCPRTMQCVQGTTAVHATRALLTVFISSQQSENAGFHGKRLFAWPTISELAYASLLKKKKQKFLNALLLSKWVKTLFSLYLYIPLNPSPAISNLPKLGILQHSDFFGGDSMVRRFSSICSSGLLVAGLHKTNMAHNGFVALFRKEANQDTNRLHKFTF